MFGQSMCCDICFIIPFCTIMIYHSFNNVYCELNIFILWSNHFQVLNEAVECLSNFESNLANNIIQNNGFLTKTTANGLKITLKSRDVFVYV